MVISSFKCSASSLPHSNSAQLVPHSLLARIAWHCLYGRYSIVRHDLDCLPIGSYRVQDPQGLPLIAQVPYHFHYLFVEIFIFSIVFSFAKKRNGQILIVGIFKFFSYILVLVINLCLMIAVWVSYTYGVEWGRASVQSWCLFWVI